MDSDEQLIKAKRAAMQFLYLPIQETELSPIVVMHPFFESAIIYDGEQSVFNAIEEKERYDNYLKKFCTNVIEKCDSISELLFRVRKSYRLTFLSFLKQKKIICLKECGNLLAETWILLENTMNDVNVKKREILSMLLAAEKNKLMTKEELLQFAELPECLTIYRGCSDAKYKTGFSWTLNETTAHFFANRFCKTGEKGAVYKAKIKKQDVICFLQSRGEEETVIDYRRIYDIEKIS